MNARKQMEHRWGARAVLNAPATLRIASEESAEATIGNASISGAYVQTTRRVPILSRIRVRTNVGDCGWLEASVVRHDNNGMGVEWLNPPLREVCALLALRQGSSDGMQPRARANRLARKLLRLPGSSKSAQQPVI